MEAENPVTPLPNGGAAAAILSAGIGCAALGLAVVLAASFVQIEDLFRIPEVKLHLSSGVGPLAGKTDFALLVWLGSWAALHRAWRAKEVEFARVFRTTLILVALGFLGTFPWVFEAVNHLIGNHP